MTAAEATDLLLRRVRDPAGIGTTRAQVRQLLTAVQPAVVLATDVRTRTSWTPTPGVCVHPLTAIGSDVLRVEAVWAGDQSVLPMPFAALAQTDRGWLRRLGSVPHSWAALGRTLLVLYPGPDAAVSLTVTYTAMPPAIDSETTLLALREDRVPLLLDLVEAALLLRSRQLAMFQTRLRTLPLPAAFRPPPAQDAA